MVKEAIILAGGLGTRLQSVVKDLPKPMADINKKPFLEYLFNYLNYFKIKKIILAVGYKKDIIKEYFGNKYKDIAIVYSEEKELLGTGGAIKQAIEFCEEQEILILNGDTFFDIDLNKFYDFHISKHSKLSLALKLMKNFDRYGAIEIDENKKIVAFLEKAYKQEGFINGGVYLLNKNFFMSLNFHEKFSFEKEFMEKYYKVYDFYGFPFDNYFIDIGIPEDYEKAKRDFENFKYR
ncbi:D-glycero-D-manno-heptose 1-phosphate guanosyltransferase [Venenivibrio stagnispumantis]|uniref:D-glycero-alpha-D-manno-heptose 1-phosphate guanylyltransferase n=1 Tax=Venenivibrio stagnispumantis TaxID=407998 RepID=A0AA45WN92_9AQUI|nr:nucleotidyltransferase family protein [Venenivibrio stagnispumantis]MCW4573215.1 nucleotidyltransferase family protein [Venenivibrio stagnispumantis]SMP17187.1 D-glycero-alpha-D-manno-heptose 1-phosphate guanylyltransferase [Venenivibrio stagnispumantis]